jgi:hypothetical protein
MQLPGSKVGRFFTGAVKTEEKERARCMQGLSISLLMPR